VEQAPSDTLPENGDDIEPPFELRVVAAQPTDPVRIETPAALAPVQDREEGRAEQAPSQPKSTLEAAPESPKVQIGLLEVVVLAPDSGSHATHPAAKARSNFASRNYLRNI
jgi:hypothetical protein